MGANSSPVADRGLNSLSTDTSDNGQVESTMKAIAKRFVADESGATAIEYGLVAAMMGIAVVTIFTAFKTSLTSAFSTMGAALNTKASGISSAQ
jgi:pilus assembly protein Flp/PilA